MRKTWNFKLRWLATTLVIGVVLLSTVASHGCDAKGTSSEQSPQANTAAP